MDRTRRILGVLFLCISVVALVSWEKYGRDRFLYDEVLVLKENVPRGTLITEDMLKTVKMASPEREALRPGDAGAAKGRVSVQFVHAGTQLFREYFEEETLTTGGEKDRCVIRIAEAWIDSLPESIGKGDRALLWAAGRYLTAARVYAVDEGRRSLELMVTKAQAEKIAAAGAAGKKITITYQ